MKDYTCYHKNTSGEWIGHDVVGADVARAAIRYYVLNGFTLPQNIKVKTENGSVLYFRVQVTTQEVNAT